MDLWLAALIILGAVALSVTAMLLVRRVAPAGTYFRDVVPAGALYTVIGTAYMVILAFVFLVAFESYHSAKSEAQNEATAALAMFHAVQPLSSKARNQLQGQVICYAREVIAKEWPAMRHGETSPALEARITAMEIHAEKAASQQSAVYEQWSASNDERRHGRQGRIAEAASVVPSVIWLVLIIGAVIVIASVCFFADSEEAWFPQAAMIAATAAIVVAGLLLVRLLEAPYENQSGSIKPTAMARSLALMQQVPNAPVVVRCD
jgi:negative regulator of sigma E activity